MLYRKSQTDGKLVYYFRTITNVSGSGIHY